METERFELNWTKQEFDNAVDALISFYNDYYSYDKDLSLNDAIQIFKMVSENNIESFPRIDYEEEFVITDAFNSLWQWPSEISEKLQFLMNKTEEKYNKYETEYDMYNKIKL